MKKRVFAIVMSLVLGISANAVPAFGEEFTSVSQETIDEVEIDAESVLQPSDLLDVQNEALDFAEEVQVSGADALLSEKEVSSAASQTIQEAAPEVFKNVPNPGRPDLSLDMQVSTSGSSASEQETDHPLGDITTDAVFASKGNSSISTSLAKITCKGSSAGRMQVKAVISKKVASKDDYYYLFQVNPVTNRLSKKVARLKKPSGRNKSIVFKLKTKDHPEYIMSKYALAVKTKSPKKLSSYQIISNTRYVQSPEKTAVYKTAYQLGATKKGLQTTTISELEDTKAKHDFLNLAVSTICSGPSMITYKYNGKKYSFDALYGYRNLVSYCNRKGIPVTMQLNLDWTDCTKDLIYVNAPASGFRYYAWDPYEKASRQKMEAMFSYLGEIFGTDDCYISNWILGNEVNSCDRYFYAGNISESNYIKLYSETFRCLYNAVRSTRASSKCFVCLDQYWNNTWENFAGKNIVNGLHANLKKMQSGVNWNLAYHAYPFPLTEPAFWSGKYAHNTPNNPSAEVISLINISALTNYIKTNFGSKTRIILSEQGFTSSKGQDIQAAAVSLAYYIAACNPMIDAFIVRSYQDEGHEVAQGLAMGLKGKKAFSVFQKMDTSKSLSYTSSYLNSQVGGNWKNHVPGFNAKYLSKTYRK